ncbi:MAG: YbhB/YbcL family Raf kinase inhibitor-like protein [Bacteroidetes bacterium]|nr:MAG: YbhB/YbcL family Raf kinase inhibitor-like protein [Bacteroidota bacterium]
MKAHTKVKSYCGRGIKQINLLIVLVAISFLYSCSGDDPVTPKDSTNVDTAELFFTTSAFASGATIPIKYTCDGIDLSPKLEWGNAPDGTMSFAIIVDDPDAIPVAGFIWDHCLILNIPSDVSSLKEGVSISNILALDGLMIKNSFKNFAYNGPCPPPNQVHTYRFELYALDVAKLSGVNSSSNKQQLLNAIDKHKLAKASFTGTFEH